MIDLKRFKDIRTLQDIKLEKARLRYKMLLAEKAVMEDLQAMQGIFSYAGLFSRLADAYTYAQNIASRLYGFYKRFFRKDQPQTES